MKNPKVTTIITSYNRFDYLLNAVDSVLDQKYENKELIIINDGSEDDRYRSYKFPKSVKILHIDRSKTPNWGGARKPLINMVAKDSESKYLAFLDDDDIWLDNKLERQISLLEESECKMSSTEGLFGEGVYDNDKNYPLYNSERWYKFISKKYKKTNYLKNKEFPQVWDLDFIRIHNCIILSSVIVETELFNRLGGFRGLPKAPDYDCWLGLLQLTNSLYVNEPLFYYDNKHGDGRNYHKIND